MDCARDDSALRAPVQVTYDPSEASYESLLDCFFAHVDPTTLDRQGNDVGTQYRSVIYYFNAVQRAAAEKVRGIRWLRGGEGTVM